MTTNDSASQAPKTNRERLITAATEALGEATIQGLLGLELDDDELIMAVYAELKSSGVPDPGAWLREHEVE